MTKVGAQRAADLTGRSKSTIQRAMTAGKLPYETDETGHRLIAVEDLDKLFGLRPAGSSSAPSEDEADEEAGGADRVGSGSSGSARAAEKTDEKIAALEARIAELETQRDAWQRQAQEAVATCQAAQKQVDEFAQIISERDRREDERRRQIIEARAHRAGAKPPRALTPASAENQNVPDAAPESSDAEGEVGARRPLTGESEETTDSAAESGGLLDFQGLWQRIKARAGAA
jgi:predicted site-specific integrase-resolvase